MKKITAKVLSVILLVATGFLGVGMAAPQGGGGRTGRSAIPPQRVLENLPGITADQLGEIDLLREEAKTTMEFLVEQQREFRQSLRTHLDSEAPDPYEVGVLVISGQDVAKEIRTQQQDFRETFQAVLTSEQLDALKEMNTRMNSRQRPGRRSGDSHNR
jgi:Spy/CpxP family protein refolding chaperone